MLKIRECGDVVGDYELVELLSRGVATVSWLAKQISVQRVVVLDLLKQEATQDENAVSFFLSDVRVKASLNHPNVGLVFEARQEGLDCYYARERLVGETLESWYEEQRRLRPLDLVRILEPIADAFLYMEREGVATVRMAAYHVYFTEDGQPRLVNLAVGGARDEATGTHDKQLLGEIFRDLLEEGHEGSTRTGSLCEYMADASREVPLTWRQVRDLSRQVREELTTDVAELKKEEGKKVGGGRVPSWFWALLAGVGMIGALVCFLVWA